MDAAAHHAIEQGGGDAAMHDAQRIVVIEDRRVGEHDAAPLDLRHLEAQHPGDRRRGKAALHQTLEQAEPVQGADLFQRHHAKTRVSFRYRLHDLSLQFECIYTLDLCPRKRRR